ncbi:superoxide dismutase [Vibrio azureus]|uniref:Superoxide dismutase [Cu-Zn] n=1 Tax=Vibrio azureus NBRC 104587 TaxID=1219077 RepID=U3ALK6_9VIBR|nr:superoxide dismutase family protein [Vibrio azureus]AUI86560.1 superoxide dismutase [Vibrio azureus]GAD74182.1 superoxide dismutase [Cu-Zn] [Vibrio azureus NBRC 104587]
MKLKAVLSILCLTSSFSTLAEQIKVEMIDLNSGTVSGSITATETEYGTVFTPNLEGLTAGLHGFHIHTNPSCESAEKNGKTVMGGAAGGHYDPAKTNKHGLPWTEGNHLGDLPPLFVDADGKASQPVLAPRIKLSDLKDRALMIHAGGDNHSDHPARLGGGGARMVCGVMSAK